MDIVGLIPAAGTATRLSPLPCSKEILPIGFEKWGNKPYNRPKVAIHYLIESMQLANITKVFITIRNNKWDIPAYLGDGKTFGVDIAYLMMGLPYGAPFSINQAHPFVRSSIVALGYPDIIFHPQTVYKSIIEKLKKENADVVLGLFPASNPHKMDMIEFDGEKNISRFVIKPQNTDLLYTYVAAVWTPVFSKFMNDYLSMKHREIEKQHNSESYIGDVFQALIDDGGRIEYVTIENGRYIDIGTIDDYIKAQTNYSKF